MASWSEVVDFSDSLTQTSSGDNDRPVTFRVMGELAVILFDRAAGKRRVISMRGATLCVVGAVHSLRRTMAFRREGETSSLMGALLMTLVSTGLLIGCVWFWP